MSLIVCDKNFQHKKTVAKKKSPQKQICMKFINVKFATR